MYDYDRIINFAESNGCEVLKNQPMSKFTSFKIGGPADVLIKIGNKNILCECIKECNKLEIPLFVLGNGSNLLVRDKGIRGVVIKLCGDFNKVVLKNETQIECGSGVSLAKLCKFAFDCGLSGLEFAWGIPGSAGGAAFMNAGAYGGEMKNVLMSCEHIDQNGICGKFNIDELRMGYRKSIYSENFFVITSLTLGLKLGDKNKIKSHMNELMERRRSKQPLDMPSAGSVFKRPVGGYAGTLIQECGLKGEKMGGAMVSDKHGNFIVNCGGATCEDVTNLILHIKRTVFEKKGFDLECEVRTIGEV